GDDLSLPERNSVRTPMQWSNEPNAGFSMAPPDQLIRSVISEGKYSYKHINVNAQRCDPSSLLNWLERAIHLRKECPELGWGKCEILETGNKRVFAHRCEWQNGVVIAVHNLGKEECTITLNLKYEEEMVELLGNQLEKPIERKVNEVKLSGYGYRWFRVGSQFITSIIC
ncbi:MAG: alpha-glucosidase C-terminal domain-containing protein, partial [Chroococcales cyanobacterium]